MRPATPLLLLLLLLLHTGCRDGQSALTPYGMQAAEVARLSWVLFIGGALVLAVVVAATWIAIRGPVAARRWLATERTVIVGGIAFPAIVLVVLLFSNIAFLQSSVRASWSAATTNIAVTGEQWWWRVAYHTAAGAPVPTANEIRIPVGRDVLFTLSSADVIHSFWVPSLGGKVDMIPGRKTKLRIHAVRPGVFRGPCAEYCGGPHALMALQVLAMPAGEFDAWLGREAGDAATPDTARQREGQSVFLASGCGACHAVRGTPADGLIGPDLTRLGSRRSIGADTLPLTRDNLIRFIAEGQSVKPGNRMPEFRILTSEQRETVADYLLSLR